jgi:hypothetical protein
MHGGYPGLLIPPLQQVAAKEIAIMINVLGDDQLVFFHYMAMPGICRPGGGGVGEF